MATGATCQCRAWLREVGGAEDTYLALLDGLRIIQALATLDQQSGGSCWLQSATTLEPSLQIQVDR